MKEFNDAHISTKFGAGSYSLSMMQSLSSKLLGGFEMIYVVSITNVINISCIATYKRYSLLLWSKLQS